MSPLRSSAGPAVCTNGTSSSSATICASEVLPRPGGPASSTWSSASPRARAASIDDRELRAQRLLPDELVERAAGAASGRARPRARSSGPGVWMRAARSLIGRARPQGAGDQVLGALAGGAASSSALGLGRARSRARPGRRARARAGRRGRGAGVGVVADGVGVRVGDAGTTFSRSSTMIRSAVRLPMPGTAWKRARRRPRSRATSSRGGAAGRAPRAPPSGPTAWTPMSSRNRSRSCSVAKPYSWSASSRTIRCAVQRAPGSPTAGTWRSVSADTAGA